MSKKKAATLGTKADTERGFSVIDFTDGNDVPCTLQESSAWRESGPMLWLGCNKPNPRVLVHGKGWQPIGLPEGTLCDTRMHLGRKQVEALVTTLQKWLKEGRL